MSLHRIGDRHPNYKQRYFNGSDLIGLPIYSSSGEKSGYVVDILVDETDDVAYLVLSVGSGLATWFGERKKVVLPADAYRHHSAQNFVSVGTLTREQIKLLPKYAKDQRLDEAYEAAISYKTRQSENMLISA